MPAESYHDFPLSPNRSWDASSAEQGLRKWASSDGSGDKDKIDWGKLKKVYFWHEAGALSDFGQLKFPYCRIENGEPHVVHNAVQNALARIDGSNIPAEDKPAVRRVAQRQMDRFQDDSSANSTSYSSNSSSSKKFGEPTDEQLAKINKMAKRALSFDEVFVFPSKLAGDMIIPNGYVQLSKELLDVFAADANKGVSLLIDHSWSSGGLFGLGGRPKAAIPYGRIFEGNVSPSNVEGEIWALHGNTYMVRGVTLDGISTDDLINSIEAGTLFDTSIGFNYNKGIWSICGGNYFNGDDCRHFAGRTYEVEGDDGVTRNVLCYIKAYPPGNLWENSLVFDGAYPTAGVLSKDGDIFENETGIYQVVTDLKGIDKPVIATYSQKTGLLTMVKKAEHKKIFSMKGGEKQMNEKVSKMLETLGIAFKEGETNPADILESIADKRATLQAEEPFMTREQAAEKLGKEYTADEVLSFAENGIAFSAQKAEYDTYRKETIDSAIAMGVRAMGNDFPADTWRATFEAMDKKAITDIANTWKAQAESTIPAGRHTNPAAGAHQVNADVPDEAYKVK